MLALGVAQTLAWASSTYLPAVLAGPMAAELGLTPAWVFGAFSGALGLMALCGPAVGRDIDRHGGRRMLCLSNLVLAAGLIVLGLAGSAAMLAVGWALLGVGMAAGLYDAAFAALVREHGLAARGRITGITLLGGFASTLGWPLSSWLAAHWDWRVACFAWAALHLCVALPLNWRFVATVFAPFSPSTVQATDALPAGSAGRRRQVLLVAVFGAATAFVTSAMAAHLPGLLRAVGYSAATAVAAAALLGPAQVVARLAEFTTARRFRVGALSVARFATALHPLAGTILLATAGLPGMAVLFSLLHGAGNGLITIAKGTLPLALFGPQGYGALQGRLAVAQRILQAAAPFCFALVLEAGGASAGLGLTVAVSLLALGALWLLRRPDD